ncbi:unnamed protein product, partial [Bubo scandiacus]
MESPEKRSQLLGKPYKLQAALVFMRAPIWAEPSTSPSCIHSPPPQLGAAAAARAGNAE